MHAEPRDLHASQRVRIEGREAASGDSLSDSTGKSSNPLESTSAGGQALSWLSLSTSRSLFTKNLIDFGGSLLLFGRCSDSAGAVRRLLLLGSKVAFRDLGASQYSTRQSSGDDATAVCSGAVVTKEMSDPFWTGCQCLHSSLNAGWVEGEETKSRSECFKAICIVD